jgi:hypothetical protein
MVRAGEERSSKVLKEQREELRELFNVRVRDLQKTVSNMESSLKGSFEDHGKEFSFMKVA